MIDGRPPRYVRRDPEADDEAARWCDMSHLVAAYVVSSPGRAWFADALWFALESGPGSPGWCRALKSAILDEIGEDGCAALSDELDGSSGAVSARGYKTRTPCEHASLVPHLVQTYLRLAGEPGCHACSAGTDRVLITARLWGHGEVMSRLHEALPMLSGIPGEIGVIRMPDHRDAIARAMAVASPGNDDPSSVVRSARLAIGSALPMHRPLLEFYLWGEYERL